MASASEGMSCYTIINPPEIELYNEMQIKQDLGKWCSLRWTVGQIH